jgi:hypothetical protein
MMGGGAVSGSRYYDLVAWTGVNRGPDVAEAVVGIVIEELTNCAIRPCGRQDNAVVGPD